MTRLEWEAELKIHLRALPREEIEKALDYYREMYGDMKEAGRSTDEILRMFGDPQICAARILLESREDAENSMADPERKQKPLPKATEEKKSKKAQRNSTKSEISVSDVVGAVFFTLLLIIPLAAVFVSLIASFGAVTVSGCAMVIAGVIFAIASPFIAMIAGTTFAGTVVNIGLGIATAGVGAILAVVFGLLTKYMSIASFKAIKAMYRRKR